MPRRHVDQSPHRILNAEVTTALTAAGRRSFTGAIEVYDRVTRSAASLYLYDGGLYAVHLEGYRSRVFARLTCSGAFASRSTAELAVLTGLDLPNPQAIATSVQQGWVSAEVLAGVHREFMLAALGSVLNLKRAKVREHRTRTTSHFCTLPLPIAPVVSAVQMRAERMAQTWSGVAPGHEPGSVVLVRTGVPHPRGALATEVRAMESAIDGVRTLDELAWELGLTRAEAVHVASILISASAARLDVLAAPRPLMSHHLVPESFGLLAIQASVVAVVPAVVAPRAGLVDVVEREQRLTSASAEVQRLQLELQRSMRAEQAAINHASEVGQLLRAARVDLARIEIAESQPVGIA